MSNIFDSVVMMKNSGISDNKDTMVNVTISL